MKYKLEEIVDVVMGQSQNPNIITGKERDIHFYKGIELLVSNIQCLTHIQQL